MLEVEITIPPGADLSLLAQAVEAAGAAEGLQVTLKGTLATYRGSTHWHFGRIGERGILEATWWPQGRRLWFKVAAGRGGSWVEQALARLKQALEAGWIGQKG